MTISASHDDWRQRVNAYLARSDEDVTRWTDSYCRAVLRHSLAGDRLFAEARAHGFWEA